MSDLFYRFIWQVGCSAFWVSSRPTVIRAALTRRGGAYILASSHLSPYDVPLLMRHTARNVDFVSIVEVFEKPSVALFYGSMNAFPLDRHRPDAGTVRIILDRLSKGRVVGMFPEGQLRTMEKSVLSGGPIRRGIGRIAMLANVPIIPAVVLNSRVYGSFSSWLPLRRVRYGIIYGQPIEANPNLADDVASDELEQRLCESLRQLYAELRSAIATAS